jgi:CRP-like cAMP-binding protein
MDKERLEKYILQLLPISLAQVNKVTINFIFCTVEKNSFLLQENKISKETYFLESGFIRSYVMDQEGQEVTTNIYYAPCFVNDFLSFFKQQPTKENFQTLTPCKLWRMSFEDVQSNFHNIPEFREFGRMMLVTNYSILNDRMIGMIKDTAETRYLNLLKQHVDIYQHVPLKIIASYLGITDSSLSRIRKELSKK